MSTVEVTVHVPGPARISKRPSGKWRPGAVLHPVSCRLPEVAVDPSLSVQWDSVAFLTDGDTLYCGTDRAVGTPLAKHLDFYVRDGTMRPGGTVDPVVADALAFPLTAAQARSFQTLAVTPGFVGPTELAAAGERSGFDVEVDAFDPDAVRSVLENRFAVSDGHLLWRTPPPDVVFAVGPSGHVRAIPSTLLDVGANAVVGFDALLRGGGRLGDVRPLARLPLTDAVDLDDLSDALHNVPFRAPGGPGALRRADGPVALPDPEARRWMVSKVSTRMASFSDGAIRAYLDERRIVGGPDDESGTEALERLLSAWADEPTAPGEAETLETLRGMLSALRAVTGPRADRMAALDTIEPSF